MQLKKNIIITGDIQFLYRYQFLFKSLSFYFSNLEFIPTQNFYHTNKSLDKILKIVDKVNNRINSKQTDRLWKNERAFISRSQQTEGKIRQLKLKPDLVLHVFGTYSPFWQQFDIPYVMYLDYTMTLAQRNWSAWAPFANDKQLAAWVRCEQQAYERAHHLFTMSQIVKAALVEDYNIKPEKITVVGSSGNFQQPYTGKKTFGSQQILFNGSDFSRKGGDLVLAAFKQVKQAIPQARLVIIGKTLTVQEQGVENPGYISSAQQMQALFLNTDLVVAPARCDPFPTFLMEAMNYGIPCIVSDRDGMPEIVEHGVSGVVIAQPTPDLLAQQIINLLSNPSLLVSMSQQAQHQISSRFNWHQVALSISHVLLNKIVPYQ